jgi:alpha-galactosidase
MKKCGIVSLCLLVTFLLLTSRGQLRADSDILTPPEALTPKINSAKVFGVRPNAPFLFTIAATGNRPMTFAAEGLPSGLKLDPQTGQITGTLTAKGDYDVTLTATNALGNAPGKLKIVCGSVIGLTPAMGWNSWNCFAGAVTEDKVKAAADTLVEKGLINHGWTYVNIDDFWQVNPSQAKGDPTLGGPQRDPQGRILPNKRFPDMKGLTDYIHAKGLKAGIYSSPGPWTCGGCVGSWRHEDQDAQQYGDWGFDYLKYDWCSYGSVVGGKTDLATLKKPYEVMRAALDKVPRDIMFSLCQYGWGNVWRWGADLGGNSWRTTGDIKDTWASMAGIGFNQAGLDKYAGPGHFNDPDMLIVGRVGWGNPHPTKLTHDEQYTHMSLWCLLSAPLLIGCDMTQMDDFTMGLLTNDEVIAIDQDPLGHPAVRISKEGPLEVWEKDLEDGSKAVGLFNLGDGWRSPMTVKFSDLGITGKQTVRDLWRQQDLGQFDDAFTSEGVHHHGVLLLKITPVK